MNPEGYSEQNLELAGWPVHLISYRLGESWVCKIDNVSPGALIARSTGETREAAELEATSKAEKRLAATRRMPVA